MTTVESVVPDGSQSPVPNFSLFSVVRLPRSPISLVLDTIADTVSHQPWVGRLFAAGIGVSMSVGVGVAIATALPIQFSLSSTIYTIPLVSTLLSPRTPAVAILPSQPIPIHIGTLRVSNQTYHPIRVALLPQLSDVSTVVRVIDQSDTHSDSTNRRAIAIDSLPPSLEGKTSYGEPIHWDFVPREGYDNGLVLALPDGQFWVQPGDIVTAFAQDGSRRYWGPYVIGSTDVPVWDEAHGEWILVLDTPFPF